MQMIQHDSKLIHPLLNEIEYFYSIASVKADKGNGNKLIPYAFDDSLKTIAELFKKHGYVIQADYTKKHYHKISFESDKKTVLVAFSGGKDSLATALWYKENGYKVYLYHLRGINKCYPKEYERVIELADKMKLPLIIERVSLGGSHCYIEHPMKNMIIANMMLSYCISHKLTANIAFGNYSTSSLNTDPFAVCGADCKETWKAYIKVIRTILPKFNVLTPLESIEDSMNCLLAYPEYIPLISSCIGTHRFTDYYRQQNERKYGIKLLPHRCGSCWKCAYEYIYLCDRNVESYNEQYYNHCLDVLRNTIKRERHQNVDRKTAFKEYLFYDIKDSHFTN